MGIGILRWVLSVLFLGLVFEESAEFCFFFFFLYLLELVHTQFTNLRSSCLTLLLIPILPFYDSHQLNPFRILFSAKFLTHAPVLVR
jgi:hypothetical protein